jgi:hypothetical protein
MLIGLTGTRIFSPFHRVRALDRGAARGRLAEAVVPHDFKRMETGIGNCLAHIGSNRTIHGSPDLVIILERKAHGIDRRDWNQGSDHQG